VTRRPRARSAPLLLAAVGLGALIGPPARSRAAAPEQVDAAVARATAYLYAKQSSDGTWEKSPAPQKGEDGRSIEGGQFTGNTALAVYALLSAGENPQDPKLAKAIDFLKKTPTQGTYALGVRNQVWLMLPQTPDVRQAMRQDATVLLRTARTQGNGQGMYDYVLDKGKAYSHSRAQYAVLGVWAAEQSGMEVPDQFWQVTERAWTRNQDASGGWAYTHPADNGRDYPVTAGMTAVGVATLFITQDYTRAATDAAACRGNVSSPAIERGLKWMADHMAEVAPAEKGGERAYPYPTLYAVERIGVAAGLKYIGGVDWYRKGADWLLAKQRKDGAWSNGDAMVRASAISDTCFALLFLARGRSPVAIAKLDFSTDPAKPAHWNQRPRDVANLTRWVGRTIERELHWQVVTLQSPLADWIEVPILYLAGSGRLDLRPEDAAKIKAYVEAGGMVVGHADCGDRAFAASFRALAADLFPGREFRELPHAGPVYTLFPRGRWKTKPSVLGVSNGARELMVLIPQADPAKAWQGGNDRGKEEMFQLAANLALYVLDKQHLRSRGQTHYVAADEKVKPTSAVTVARLEYAGNWDPEPGGWRRLAAVLRNDRKVDLTVTPVKLGAGDLAKSGATVAHLTGTDSLKLDAAQAAELEAFVAAGGTLVMDAAGGSGAFATDAERLAADVAPGGAKPEPLPPDHPLYTASGKPLAVEFRPYAQVQMAGGLKGPQLKAVLVDRRPAVIVSREDLSVGLVGNNVEGILGYAPATATELMARIVTMKRTGE